MDCNLGFAIPNDMIRSKVESGELSKDKLLQWFEEWKDREDPSSNNGRDIDAFLVLCHR